MSEIPPQPSTNGEPATSEMAATERTTDSNAQRENTVVEQSPKTIKQQLLAVVVALLGISLPLLLVVFVLLGHSITQVRTFTGPKGLVTAVAISPDGRFVAAGGVEKKVWIWQTDNGVLLHTLTKHVGDVTSVAFSPDGNLLATAGLDRVYLWEASTGRHVRTIDVPTNFVLSAVFSPDGKYLVTTSKSDPLIRVWHVQTGQASREFTGHKRPVQCVAFHPDNKQLVSVSDSHLRIWDVESRKAIRSLKSQTATTNCICYTPDGQYILTGGRDGAIYIWDANGANEQPIGILHGHKSPVISLTVSPDSQYVASGSLGAEKSDGSSQDTSRTLRIWSLAARREAYLVDLMDDGIWSVVFSPDGKFLLSGGADRKVRLWSIP